MRKKNYHYYRKLHTHGERVANEEMRDEDGVRAKWGRACRNNNLLDPWNNEQNPICQKTWKVFRKNQYRPGKRGQKHILHITEGRWNRWSTTRKFKEYCRDHDIPYEVNELAHLESQWVYQKSWTVLKYVPYLRKHKKDGYWVEIRDMQPVYGYIYHRDLPLIKRTWSVYDGTELIWWSDKDIGIEYILVEK